ncbi:MAG: rhomboid family intramembrane serine protease [Winogradskyella sp.]|uniref:rhomboid family intramembrane serine protease n=1 Tax=Winogradskyella sp. TaxID=1883156 RepID=UPI000F3BB5A3|nr:rhomboid family intramembrane serine protease [Winogradskyella sp.]RNC83498.1 MAG: rhomboid family intramembrane serine protease [Winogradskyella sp.]
MGQQQFKYSNTVIVYPLLLVFLIWLVFWYQVRIDSGIRHLGIYPQKIEGILGIFTSPFIHSDLSHLYNNSIPLLVLSMALFYFYNKIAWRVLLFGLIISGFLTWFIGKSGNHIGASGLIYVLVSFIFFKGIFAKHYRLIALSLIIIFLYGSMIWYVFPIKDNMSWEGHLSGLITGLIFALIFRNQIAKPERYVWETESYNEDDDPFMKHFDDNGNFIEILPEEDNPDSNYHDNGSPRINYNYKEEE